MIHVHIHHSTLEQVNFMGHVVKTLLLFDNYNLNCQKLFILKQSLSGTKRRSAVSFKAVKSLSIITFWKPLFVEGIDTFQDHRLCPLWREDKLWVSSSCPHSSTDIFAGKLYFKEAHFRCLIQVDSQFCRMADVTAWEYWGWMSCHSVTDWFDPIPIQQYLQ